MKRKSGCLTWLSMLAIIASCLFAIFCMIERSANVSSVTDRNKIDFYRALLYEMQDSSRIPIDRLVPVEWEHMKVFRAYATRDTKVEYAGYEYADDLTDIYYENELSLLFLTDGKVVYYVDSLLPRMLKYENLENGLVDMSFKNGWYSVAIDASVSPAFSDWGYHPEIEEASIEDEPYIEIRYLHGNTPSLSINCE